MSGLMALSQKGCCFLHCQPLSANRCTSRLPLCWLVHLGTAAAACWSVPSSSARSRVPGACCLAYFAAGCGCLCGCTPPCAAGLFLLFYLCSLLASLLHRNLQVPGPQHAGGECRLARGAAQRRQRELCGLAYLLCPSKAECVRPALPPPLAWPPNSPPSACVPCRCTASPSSSRWPGSSGANMMRSLRW